MLMRAFGFKTSEIIAETGTSKQQVTIKLSHVVMKEDRLCKAMWTTKSKTTLQLQEDIVCAVRYGREKTRSRRLRCIYIDLYDGSHA